MINTLQIVRGVCFWAQLYCVSARTLWRWARASVTAWASGTTLKLPSSDWGSWRWWPSPNSSARAPSPPPPSWRAAALPTSSPPATADATGAWRRPSLARRRSNWHTWWSHDEQRFTWKSSRNFLSQNFISDIISESQDIMFSKTKISQFQDLS